jgi:Helix-turn-helix domain
MTSGTCTSTPQGAELSPSHGLPRIPKGRHLTREEQQVFADLVAKAYERGASIRVLMGESGRSYGCIHRIIADHPDVRLRSRGGDRRGNP